MLPRDSDAAAGAQSVTVLGYILGGIFWLGLALGAAASVSGNRDAVLMVFLAIMAAAGAAMLLVGCIAQAILVADRERAD